MSEIPLGHSKRKESFVRIDFVQKCDFCCCCCYYRCCCDGGRCCQPHFCLQRYLTISLSLSLSLFQSVLPAPLLSTNALSELNPTTTTTTVLAMSYHRSLLERLINVRSDHSLRNTRKSSHLSNELAYRSLQRPSLTLWTPSSPLFRGVTHSVQSSDSKWLM